MVGRLVAGLVVAIALLGGCSGGQADDPGAGPSGADTAATTAALDLAGDLSQNGRISLSGVEMQSTPGSLYPSQTDGGTALGGVAGVTAGLTVIREGEQLCVGVHGLPIGGNRLAGTCDIPAYETHEDVAETAWAYVSDVVVEGEPVRVVWGMTYLDAVTADLGPGTLSQALESHLPYWMHRFFALEATADTTSVRLLNEAGDEIATLSLQPQ